MDEYRNFQFRPKFLRTEIPYKISLNYSKYQKVLYTKVDKKYFYLTTLINNLWKIIFKQDIF